MTDTPDLTGALARLRRPKMLVGAARRGLELYRREVDLRRILRGETRAAVAGARLLDAEQKMENTRRKGEAGYSIAAHIELLTALMAEAAVAPRHA